MKKILIALVLLVPIVALGQKKFAIRGQFVPDSSEMVFLRYDTPSGLKSDSAKTVNGKFVLSSPISSITEGYLSVRFKGKSSNPRKIFLEPLEMTLISKSPTLNDLEISGSPVNNDHKVLLTALKPVTDKYEHMMRRWRAASNKMDTAFRRAFFADQTDVELRTRETKALFAANHLDSYVGLLAALESGTIDFYSNFDGAVIAFKRFSQKVRETDLGKGLQERIDGALKTKVGLMAMDFTQKDTKGMSVKLSDFKGKYVLLDFWASWCAPCRQETPALVKAYNNYHEKGFTILSVSLDKSTEKQAWLKAIEKDGMLWNNVSDLNYWRNQAAVLYGIKTVPANFLIDPTGRIIAKDLRGEQVSEKLAELLK